MLVLLKITIISCCFCPRTLWTFFTLFFFFLSFSFYGHMLIITHKTRKETHCTFCQRKPTAKRLSISLSAIKCDLQAKLIQEGASILWKRSSYFSVIDISCLSCLVFFLFFFCIRLPPSGRKAKFSFCKRFSVLCREFCNISDDLLHNLCLKLTVGSIF